MDKNQDKGEEMIPFFSVASKDFDQDLTILKKVLDQLEQRTHSDENAYKFSQRATMAAGWWFYDIFFKPYLIFSSLKVTLY